MSERGKTVFYTVSFVALAMMYVAYIFGWPL